MAGEGNKAGLQLHTVELFIGNLLRYGVILCSLVIALGIGLSLAAAFSGPSPLAAFLQEVMRGQLLPDAVPLACFASGQGLACLTNPETVIALGLLLLIALPILRVGMTMVVFLVQRDIIYTFISGLVLAILLLGLFLGKEL